MKTYPVKAEYENKIRNWYKISHGRIFVISGYAGTGKTSLARSIPSVLGISPSRVAFLAPTGKAALLMQGGRTIHSYLYHAHRDKESGEVTFIRKEQEDFTEELLIVDEISMVSDELLEDLKSARIPIIGLGDSAQLPPVNGANTLLDHADIYLTEVFRNDGGILSLATDIRNGEKLKLKYNDVKTISRQIYEDLSLVDDDTIVICKFNKTRRKINLAYRELKYKTELILVPGEKLIVTKNNSSTKLMNGSIITVDEIIAVEKNSRKIQVMVIDDTGERFSIRIDASVLLGQDSLSHTAYKDDGLLHEVDYAYAITCHKAQGSEFKKVFIVNEGKFIENHQAWFYTAVTRAREQIRIYN